MLFEKKFPLASANPAVGSFGGRSLDVWAAVTSSGVVRLTVTFTGAFMMVDI